MGINSVLMMLVFCVLLGTIIYFAYLERELLKQEGEENVIFRELPLVDYKQEILDDEKERLNNPYYKEVEFKDDTLRFLAESDEEEEKGTDEEEKSSSLASLENKEKE
jgi:hypothetical protein